MSTTEPSGVDSGVRERQREQNEAERSRWRKREEGATQPCKCQRSAGGCPRGNPPPSASQTPLQSDHGYATQPWPMGPEGKSLKSSQESFPLS